MVSGEDASRLHPQEADDDGVEGAQDALWVVGTRPVQLLLVGGAGEGRAEGERGGEGGRWN